MDGAQQTAAIILQLGGAARDLARNLTYQEITQGGMIGGQQVDPVTFLLTHLATSFAPLGEEARLAAISELMQFHRQPGEQIDGMLSRFMTLRHRAAQGGAGMIVSWEGYNWLLLRACGVNQNQLLNVLQPFQGRFPGTEAEFGAMQLTLRRMGHILEHTPLNIASQLRMAPTRSFFAGAGEETQAQQDPWQYGPDPWAVPEEAPPAASSQWQGPPDGPAYYVPHAAGGSTTDTETASSIEETPDYSDPALYNMTPRQVDERRPKAIGADT
jgi:hypothetical protein